MRFLADMGISSTTVTWLRTEGHDVVHARELGMARAPDALIVEKAGQEGRVILTCDLDFGDIMASSGAVQPAIILIRLRNQTPAHVNGRLRQVLAQSHPAITNGALVTVEESRHRVRLLPLSKESDGVF